MSPVPSSLKPPTAREQSVLLREKYTRRLHPGLSYEGLRSLGNCVMPWMYYQRPWGVPSETSRVAGEVLQYAGSAVEYAARWPDRDLGDWFDPVVLRAAALSGLTMRDLLRRYAQGGPPAFLADQHLDGRQGCGDVGDAAAQRLPDVDEVEALVAVAGETACRSLAVLDNVSGLAASVLYDRWPGLGTVVAAKQPVLPDGLLVAMANGDDTFLRVEVARRAGLSDLLVAVLLRDEHSLVRAALVENPDVRRRLSRDDVTVLASSRGSQVGVALCRFMPVLEESVLWVLVAGFGRTRHVDALLGRPDLTEPMLLDLVSTRQVVAAHLDLVASHAQAGEALARVLAGSLPGARAATKAGLTIGSVRVDRWLARSHRALERARAAAVSPDGSVLRGLASDSAVSVRRRVAIRMLDALSH